jgi:predicted RNA-binding Zn-ribbon protein involved in translation (DUF1610 family)
MFQILYVMHIGNMMQQQWDDKELNAAINYHIDIACGDPPAPLNVCPKCGWIALIYRTWKTDRWMRDYRCLQCGWEQSGTCGA